MCNLPDNPAQCTDPDCVCHGRSKATACAELIKSDGLKKVDNELVHMGTQFFCTRGKGHQSECRSCGTAFVRQQRSTTGVDVL